MKNEIFNISRQVFRMIVVSGFTCVFIFTPSYAATVGYWRFEGGVGSAYNSPTLDATVGLTAPGYSSNVPYSVIIGDPKAGANTESLDVGNGTAMTVSDYALINAAVEGSFTIEMFMFLRSGTNTGWNGIMGNVDEVTYTHGWQLNTDTAGRVSFYCNDGVGWIRTLLSTPLTHDVWHHVAVVGTFVDVPGAQNYTDLAVYVDYVDASVTHYRLNSAGDEGPALVTNNSPYWMAGMNPFSGLFDELRISNVALPSESFLHIFNPPASCAEVWERGYGYPADLNKDCRVDFLDLAILAEDWLGCFTPGDPGCTL